MIALVTGSSRGIGFEIARTLVQEGYTCILTARKPSENIEQLMGEYGDKVRFVSADISRVEGRANIVRYIEDNFSGKIDILVNNAGVAPKTRKDMLTLTEEEFDYVVDINLKGTFFMAQAIANLMVKNGCGRIVNISSLSSYTASTERAEYCIAKAGISMITKLFTARTAKDGVRVFEISPGIISTDMTKCVNDKYTRLINDGLTPIDRMGEPADIAKCVAAIASGNLDFCTGTVLHADGGFSVRRL